MLGNQVLVFIEYFQPIGVGGVSGVVCAAPGEPVCSLKGGDPAAPSDTATLLRLHPSHEPYRGRRPPLQVRLTTSGRTHSHGVTGGVYKTRERIHRGMLIRDY